jgi:hypothetical protein
MTHAHIHLLLAADQAVGAVVRVAGIPFGIAASVLTGLLPTYRGKLR